MIILEHGIVTYEDITTIPCNDINIVITDMDGNIVTCEKGECMNREQIISCIQELAKHNGFYGRLLEEMNARILTMLEKQCFKDEIDLVLYLEN